MRRRFLAVPDMGSASFQGYRYKNRSCSPMIYLDRRPKTLISRSSSTSSFLFGTGQPALWITSFRQREYFADQRTHAC
ncbi:hypothetical protein DZC30_11285 [Comamonas testosteroni]|uniref:Uncharacterized protein n=1 Tax=Comamonas testosteroni TaxID=285 RepID=A0A373FN74_COMTE|nr:hypothetical protein DZC30_11285 [Comamonas testosteroni]